MNYTNYNLTCQDPTFVFQSLDHLSECFQTDARFVSFDDGWWLTDGSGNPSWPSSDISSNNRTLAGLIYNCINQYCQSPDPTLGGCTDGWATKSQYYWLTNQSIGGLSFNTPACSGINSAVNPDIQGVGVCSAFRDFYLCFIGLTDSSDIFPGARIVRDSSRNNLLHLGGHSPVTASPAYFSDHVNHVCDGDQVQEPAN